MARVNAEGIGSLGLNYHPVLMELRRKVVRMKWSQPSKILGIQVPLNVFLNPSQAIYETKTLQMQAIGSEKSSELFSAEN